jgi:tetratricopeptide (TPR) repeat protein
MVAPAPRRSFGPLLAILFVAGAIYATIANQEHDRPSSPATPVTKQSQAPVASQKTPVVQLVARPPPISRETAVAVPLGNTPPVQSLEIPDSALATNRSTEASNPNNFSAADMVTPAPGCGSLPSYASVSNVCGMLDEHACNSNPLCSWGTGAAKCYPRQGAWASPNPLKFPGDIDYEEPIFSTIIGSKPSRMEIGDGLVAKKRFDRAVAEYTIALQSDSNSPEVLNLPAILMKRAMAYEAKKDKPRAIADYCKILVIFSNRERRAIAMERIARLTQAQQQQANVPPPGPVAADKIATSGLPPPPTGDIQRRRRRNAIAPFSVITESGQNYLIKLVNIDNARDQIWIYLKGGESYSTKVPVGTYNFRAATGNEWYGREDLFGPNTRFFRLRAKKGAAVDTQQKLEFRKERNRIFGMTISLKSVANGNMEQESMNRSDFDAN